MRFAPSPTGSLHLGNALTAVVNRTFADAEGGTMLLRIDDTDAARGRAEDSDGIVQDLEWLGVAFDEGPLRQSERSERYREAAERLLAGGQAYEEGGAVRLSLERHPTLLRPGGAATYHLASVVDDLELGITHVIRGKDHLPNTPLHVALAEALGGRPPEYVHHGLVLGADGRKLSKRHGLSALADLRAAGIPGEAVRAYLEELGLPRGDVQLDLARLRRLSVEALAAMSDADLAARAGAPPELAPALRGARDLNEARESARAVLEPERADLPAAAEPTLTLFRELRRAAGPLLEPEAARTLVENVKAGGGNLRLLRLALTGRPRGPELWAVVAALPAEEALRRVSPTP